MASQGEASSMPAGVPHLSRGRRLRGALLLVMGCLAILSPFFAGSLALFLVVGLAPRLSPSIGPVVKIRADYSHGRPNCNAAGKAPQLRH